MERRIIWTAGLAASLLAASGAAGHALIQAHARQLYADTYVHKAGIEDSDNDSASAPGAGVWNHDVLAQAVVDLQHAAAFAEQYSLISATELSGYGLAAYDVYANAPDGEAEASAQSTYEVLFAVPDDQAYELEVTLGAWCDGGGNAAVSAELQERDTLDYYFSESIVWPHGEETTWTTSGTLPPGEYRLRVNASVSALVSNDLYSGNSYFDFTLNVPAPGSAAGLLFGGLMLTRRRRC